MGNLLKWQSEGRGKGTDLTQSYDKSPDTNRKLKLQKQSNKTKTPPKTSIAYI